MLQNCSVASNVATAADLADPPQMMMLLLLSVMLLPLLLLLLLQLLSLFTDVVQTAGGRKMIN